MIAVRRQLLESPEFSMLGDTKEDRKRAVFGCPASDTECEGGGGLVIDITIDNDLQTNARKVGQQLRADLAGLADEIPNIAEVRGKGLMLGVEFVGFDTLEVELLPS